MHIHVEAMLESEIRRKFGPLRTAVVYCVHSAAENRPIVGFAYSTLVQYYRDQRWNLGENALMPFMAWEISRKGSLQRWAMPSDVHARAGRRVHRGGLDEVFDSRSGYSQPVLYTLESVAVNKRPHQFGGGA